MPLDFKDFQNVESTSGSEGFHLFTSKCQTLRRGHMYVCSTESGQLTHLTPLHRDLPNRPEVVRMILYVNSARVHVTCDVDVFVMQACFARKKQLR